MNRITSRANPVIKQITALASADERKKQQLFIAEGLRTCATLCASKIQLKQLFVTSSMLPNVQSMLSDFQKFANTALIIEVTDPVMEKISHATTPSGILGVFHIPQSRHTITGSGIVLAQVREPGNVGTLIRSCAAFGMRSVILIESADCWSPKVVQAAAGTLGAVDIFVMSWEELLMRKGNLKLCALVVRNGKSPQALQLTASLLVIGNEAQGIPVHWIADCEQHMTLPMSADTESLNAAVAGSIGLYEMIRIIKDI